MSNVLRSMMGRAGLSFGHLAKVSARSSRAEENDDQDDRDDDSGKGKKGKRAESDDDDDGDGDDDGQNRDNGDSKKGKRAEGDDGDDDDRDDDSGKGKKGKRAESDDDDDGDRAEDDDDDEEEMRGKSAVSGARRRERARCAAIFGCKEAGRNPVLAANLAFNTTMTRKQAVRVLRDTPAPQGNYGSRRNPNLGNGGEQGQTREQASAASWDRAFAKVRQR
ncbi:hypothetical protein [Paraburkholderia tropica]|uniref:hypothetical protein n=1 Tax=Paraburkholderia tropica TaxID=92647 RepID=UPI002AB63778|nr:hypothetical protein [Paraburkholderia tropica]